MYQRMVRGGEWKLNYYHDMPCQLFNLREDPRELDDRANDPAHRGVRDELVHLVLRDWDPEWVKAQMAERRADQPILNDWAQRVQPADKYRWPLLTGMDYLDKPPSSKR